MTVPSDSSFILHPSSLFFGRHVLDVLREIESESVHCIITSPPYWGLRAYSTDPQIWPPADAARQGGFSPLSSDWQSCPHQWQSAPPRRPRSASDVKDPNSKEATNPASSFDISGGHFCSLCGSWRGELGQEPTPELYVYHLTLIFHECFRVLRKDGTLWLNLGDSYVGGKGQSGQGDADYHEARVKAGQTITHRAQNFSGPKKTRPTDDMTSMRSSGLKPKDLVGIPWMVAFALRADGWYLRACIPWLKRNKMPESVTDRPTVATEYVFLLSKSPRYFYDREAVKVLGSINSHGGGDPNSHADRKSTIAAGGGSHHSGLTVALPAGQSGRNRRDMDWFMESFQGLLTDDDGDPLALLVNTVGYKGSHYAVFPPKLVRPMILAGTSAYGCCPICSAPYERFVEKGMTDHDGATATSYGSGSNANRLAKLRQAARERGEEYVNTARTLGWQPTCSCIENSGKAASAPCDSELHPCTVLDPFCGSGTTLQVAKELGRHYIGIDLDERNLKLVKERLARTNTTLTIDV